MKPAKTSEDLDRLRISLLYGKWKNPHTVIPLDIKINTETIKTGSSSYYRVRAAFEWKVTFDRGIFRTTIPVGFISDGPTLGKFGKFFVEESILHEISFLHDFIHESANEMYRVDLFNSKQYYNAKKVADDIFIQYLKETEQTTSLERFPIWVAFKIRTLYSYYRNKRRWGKD